MRVPNCAVKMKRERERERPQERKPERERERLGEREREREEFKRRNDTEKNENNFLPLFMWSFLIWQIQPANEKCQLITVYVYSVPYILKCWSDANMLKVMKKCSAKLLTHFFVQVSGRNSREEWNHSTISVRTLNQWLHEKEFLAIFTAIILFMCVLELMLSCTSSTKWRVRWKMCWLSQAHFQTIFVWFYQVFIVSVPSVEQVVCLRISISVNENDWITCFLHWVGLPQCSCSFHLFFFRIWHYPTATSSTTDQKYIWNFLAIVSWPFNEHRNDLFPNGNIQYQMFRIRLCIFHSNFFFRTRFEKSQDFGLYCLI